MCEKEQLEYLNQTGKKAIYFNKQTNEFKEWFKRKEREEFLIKEDDDIELKEGIKQVIEAEKQESNNLKGESKSLNEWITGKTNKEVELERIEKIRKNYEKEQKLKELVRIRKLEEKKEDQRERKLEKATKKAIKRKVCEITEEIDIYELKKMLEDLNKELNWRWMSDEEILEWFKKRIGQEKLEQQQQLHNQYKLERDKDFMTLKNKLRIDYIRWKNRKLKEDNRKRKLKEAEELAPFHEAIKKYKLETGKSPLTLKDTIRKDYLKWNEEKKIEKDINNIDEEKEDDIVTKTINQYTKETGKSPYNDKNNELSKEFYKWLDEKNAKKESYEVFMYKNQTGISAYKKDNKTLTQEFYKWYNIRKERKERKDKNE